MYKKILFILLTLFLVSCSGGALSKGTKYQGVGSLNVEFDSDSLYQDFYSSTDVIMRLKLENDGVFDIDESSPAKISISTEKDVLEYKEGSFNIDLEGIKDFYPDGEYVEEDITFKVRDLFSLESRETEIFVNYCYPYKTHFSIPVCVMTGIKDDLPDGCPSTEQSFSGQGSPVGVTNFKPTFIPTKNGAKPQFVFEIEKLVDGNIIRKSEYGNACGSGAVGKNNFGVIDIIDKVYLGETPLTCRPEKLILDDRIKSNEYYDSSVAKLVCEGDEIKRTAPYKTVLRFDFEYGFHGHFSEKIEIKQIR